MAKELKASLERFVRKYERNFQAAKRPGISSEESFERALKGAEGEESRQQTPSGKSPFLTPVFTDAGSHSSLQGHRMQPYNISP
jgi:hypothetical protein